MTPHLRQTMKRTKETVDEVKEESEKVGLILNLQKTKNTEAGPTPSWQIDGKTMKTVTNFSLEWLQNHCRW